MSYPNALRFDLSADDITRQCDENLKKYEDVFGKIAAAADAPTVENVLIAMSRALRDKMIDESNLTTPSHVHPEKAVREASHAAMQRYDSYDVDLWARPDLYKALVALRDSKPTLDHDDERLLTRLIVRFEREGLALSDADRGKYLELKKRLTTICNDFSQNLNEDTSSVKCTRAQLEGLPDGFIDALGRDGDDYIVTNKYPELFPVLRLARVADTRKRVDFMSAARLKDANSKLMEEAIALRHDLARMFGYETHADYVLAYNRMASSAAQVREFLGDLETKLDTAAHAAIEELKALKAAECAERHEEYDGEFQSWDWNYYLRMYKEVKHNIDGEEIRKYFPMEHVLEKMLQMYQTVLNLEFRKLSDEARHVWHADVSQYEVYDKTSQEFMGHFYLDLFPRDGKYGHAAAFPLLPASSIDTPRQHPTSAMVANFTKPTETRPSLMDHQEVVTLFHEFGHIMHGLCSTTKHSLFSGTSVERDFVEAPSQMKENWAWDLESLLSISSHYETGQPLPVDMAQRLIDTRFASASLFYRRQLFFATFDLTVHSQRDVDTASLWAEMRKRINLVGAQPGTNGAATFGHLMGGYDVGYYGYLWSEVLSHDIWRHFHTGFASMAEAGLKYRQTILSRGGSVPAAQMLVDFLGREVSNDSFLSAIGAK